MGRGTPAGCGASPPAAPPRASPASRVNAGSPARVVVPPPPALGARVQGRSRPRAGLGGPRWGAAPLQGVRVCGGCPSTCGDGGGGSPSAASSSSSARGGSVEGGRPLPRGARSPSQPAPSRGARQGSGNGQRSADRGGALWWWVCPGLRKAPPTLEAPPAEQTPGRLQQEKRKDVAARNPCTDSGLRFVAVGQGACEGPSQLEGGGERTGGGGG